MKKIILLFITIISAVGYAQDGTLDLDYNPALNNNLTIEKIVLQPDGKALVQEKHQSTPYQTRITRLLDDGAIDDTFICALGEAKPLNLGAVQSDGKIIIIQNNFPYMNALVYRLNPDGSVDSDFKTLLGSDGIISSVALQPNGKIILSGTFSIYNSKPANRIVRLEANGDTDPNFQYPNPSFRITNAKVLGSGKILVLCQYTPQSSGHLIRLNANGTFDTTYRFSENCYMYPYALQSSEKSINQESCIDWTSDTPPYELLYRVNSDGAPDSTFASLGFDTASAVAFWALPDDSILVSGFFNFYGGTASTNILKLDRNGQLDPTFNGGSGPNDEIWDIAQQADGKIIMVGSFTAYNATDRNHIGRLYNSRLGVNEFESAGKLSVYPNPASNFIEFRLADGVSVTEFEIFDVNSRKVKTKESAINTINISNLESGIYFLKAKTDDGVLATKFIKN